MGQLQTLLCLGGLKERVAGIGEKTARSIGPTAEI